MSKIIVDTTKAPAAVGTYSQGVGVNGTFYFSGQIGLSPTSGLLAEGFKAQMQQILDNIDGLLESQDLGRANIVKTSIFVTDLANFGLVNEAYISYFQKPYPARSTVEVSKLPKDALVEIEVIAIR
jgi:2-iminobutanoate/2-iminopropanoate deaminase